MLVKRFGESFEAPPLIQWYENDKGEVIQCDEETINKIWFKWVTTEGVNRNDNEQFTIFEFPQCTKINQD